VLCIPSFSVFFLFPSERESLEQFSQLIQSNQEGIVRLLNYTALGVPFENIVYVYPIQQGGKTVMWFGAQAASAIIEPTAKEIAQQQFESSKDKKKKKKKKSKGDDLEEVGPDPSKSISRQMSDEENLFPGSNVRVRSLTTTDNKPFGESHFANTEPVFFVSQYARGQVLVKTRGHPVMPSVAEFFQNTSSNLEIQIQFEMTKVWILSSSLASLSMFSYFFWNCHQELPSDKNTEFHIGFEVRDALTSNWQYQFVNRILMACINDARARRADPHICLGKYRLTSGASSAGSALSAASSNGYGRGDTTSGNRLKAGSRLAGHQSSGGLSNSSGSSPSVPAAPVVPVKKQSNVPSNAVNPNALEYPHVVLPLGTFPDRLIVTSIPNRAAREHIPVLTLLSPLPSEPLPGSEEVTKVYEDGAGVRIVRAQTGNVYTMSISTSMLDLESWNLVRIPGVQQMNLAQVIGESFHLVCYTLGPPPVTINNSEQREHRLRDRTVLFDIEFSNSQN
jgi:hypothetical protein